MNRLPTCLVKMYDNMPPLSTISCRISFFLLNESSEEAAKSTANWQLRNISETGIVPMTRSNRNNSDLPNFHFAVQHFRVPRGGDLGTGIYMILETTSGHPELGCRCIAGFHMTSLKLFIFLRFTFMMYKEKLKTYIHTNVHSE